MTNTPCHNSNLKWNDSVIVLWCYIYNTHHNTPFLLPDSVIIQAITPTITPITVLKEQGKAVKRGCTHKPGITPTPCNQLKRLAIKHINKTKQLFNN